MKMWFSKDHIVDQTIIKDFSSVHQELVANLYAFGHEPDQLLAAVIVLDQFSRNMFRDDEKSFANDEKALDLTKVLHKAILSGETNFDKYEKMFTYMPIMHSEQQKDHEWGIEIFANLAKQYPKSMESVFKYEMQHADIIKRFNRYPHRNIILRRESTPEEIEFLKSEGSSF